MKKIALPTSLIICLLGLNFAKAQTSDFIIPANVYTLASNAGTFTDIADNPNTVKCGESLASGTALLNGFFIDDAATPFVTHVADKTKTDPGFALGFDFNFCGKTMKYFTICASGGIQFGAEANILQAQSSPWNTMSQDYQNIVSLTTWEGDNNTQDPPLSINGQAPVMYLIEGEAGQKVLTVQYHYTVNGDEWTYQLKVHEASGDIEFVTGDLNTQHVGAQPYRLFFGLIENGNFSIPNEPFKTMNLHFSDLASHKVGFENKSETDAWNTSTIYTPYTSSSIGNGLSITPSNKPQSGYTLTFKAPTDCAPKAKAFEDEWYSFSTTNVTKTSFSGSITLIKDAISPADMQSVGTLVAILSTSETPDYTLSNGTWHKVGEKPNPHSQILFNGKPTYDTYEDHISTVTGMPISANGLTEATTYYIHIYAMDYRCTGAPVYSDLCRTFSFTTSIDLPKTLTAGLPTTGSVPLTVQSAGDGFGVVLLKSPNANRLKLSGKLKAGDQIGDAEVLTVIESANKTAFDAPFAAGEGAYILAYSVQNPDAESPVYGQDYLSLPVRAAYDHLPTFTFDNETITLSGQNEYGRLPFGWSRETEFPENERSRAFKLENIDHEFNCLNSTFPASATYWSDVVTPAFAIPAGKTRIAATFYIAYVEGAGMGTPSIHKPNATDFVRIEYSVNGNEWQTVLEMNGFDDDFPQLNDQKQYPLNATISALRPGDIVRLRYSYRSPVAGDNPPVVQNRIRSVEIIDGKECEQPRSFLLIDSLTTNDQLTFHWFDNNLPIAPNFVLAYQTEDGTAWQYKRIAASANRESGKPVESSLSDLKTGTTYRAKVAALCGLRDSSFFTEPLIIRTAYGLPYTESMAQTGNGATAQTPFDRGLKTYSGVIGRQLTETTGTQTGWSQTRTSDPYNRANAISVNDYETNAWLMMPAIYIRESGDFTPKSLTFMLSSFDSDRNKGAQPNYNDTKLKILASDNGLFTQENIVLTLDSADLLLNEQDFTIDLTEWEGFLQIAFVFECPMGARKSTDENEDADAEERPEPWYIEIQNLALKYDVDVCFPAEKLSYSLGAYELPLDWNESTTAVEYGIFWKPESEAEYSVENAAYTKETHYTITGLKDWTYYNVMVVAYCDESRTLASEPLEDRIRTMRGCHTPENFHVEDITANSATFVSTSDQISTDDKPGFLDYRIVYITPDNSDKSFTIIQKDDRLPVRDSLSKATAYTATTQAVCEDLFSPMSEAIHFTTLSDMPKDTTTQDSISAVETIAQLSGLFSVRTVDGQVAIQNPNNLLIRNVTVFNLNGTQLADFRTDSRDDLLLPVNARRMLIFVRLQTERGTVVYKTILN